MEYNNRVSLAGQKSNVRKITRLNVHRLRELDTFKSLGWAVKGRHTHPTLEGGTGNRAAILPENSCPTQIH